MHMKPKITAILNHIFRLNNGNHGFLKSQYLKCKFITRMCWIQHWRKYLPKGINTQILI